MKREIFVVIVVSILASGCGVFGSSSNGPDFDYRFKTSKSHYFVDSTLAKRPYIKATFINKSAQMLYLGYQTCVLVGLESLQNSIWKKYRSRFLSSCCERACPGETGPIKKGRNKLSMVD